MNSSSVPLDPAVLPPSVPLRRKLAVLAASFAGLFLLGWVDYLTGYEFGFFVFYSLPVGFTAWYAGRWPALLVALASALTWWLADRFNGVNASNRFYLYWNLSIHFVAFVINAITISKIKEDVDERHALEAELNRVKQLLAERSGEKSP